MTSKHRAGRLLVVGFEGNSPPTWVFAFARRFGLGGVILFARNCPDGEAVREVLRELREGLADADPGGQPLVLVDQEGGRVERIREGVLRLPPAGALAERGEAELRSMVELQARALARLGVDVNLAPVCDVVQEGESGAIGDRSFGRDPDRVGDLVAAHVGATLAGGVLPCAKHFPGHGGASQDSHTALPRVGKGLDAFRAFDLTPFARAVDAGVPLVMAAHLLCLRVSPRPASLSARWIQGVLRGELGFDGAVISDDMEMGALTGLGPPAELAVEAVLAGCDLLIYGRVLRPDLDVFAVAERLERSVPGDRLAQALARRTSLPRFPR